MRTINTYLCIGGPNDGQRIEASGKQLRMVPKRMAMADYIPPRHVTIPPPSNPDDDIVYNLEELRAKDTSILFWAPSGQDPAVTFQRLFEFYKPPKE
jgi:hypothetical protein